MSAIRLFRPEDRPFVRQLALDTADGGKPSRFPDQTLQADLLTAYYTDHEPESLWIAEKNGRPIGYLTGCLSTPKFLRWLFYRAHPMAALRLIFRHPFNAEIWSWARSRVKTLRAGGAHQPAWVATHPAHLHINIKQEARGTGLGSGLMNAFIAETQAAGIAGIHLSTLMKNTEAQRFFSKHGFSPLAHVSAFSAKATGFETIPVMVMARKIHL